LLAVASVSPQEAWITAADGTIYHTTNSGNDWIPQSWPVATALNDVVFLSSTAGWAVGDNGVILHTADGGQSWRAQTSATLMPLHSVVFADSLHGWVAGSNGTLLHTTNGGATWERDPSGLTRALYGLARSPVTGQLWACGDNGTILRSGATPSGLSPNPFILHPSSFSLSAYPNPFNPTTTLAFSLPSAGRVKLQVYDLTGRLVTTLADRVLAAGNHTYSLDATACPSGIYFARLSGPSVSVTHKLVLLK
jgi:hypothetical protein